MSHKDYSILGVGDEVGSDGNSKRVGVGEEVDGLLKLALSISLLGITWLVPSSVVQALSDT